ncbi:PEBP-like protein [Rickenella mellea]|uniref:PEBP-like protein n=1 Tax=Rickenella mellea TaxID=50990 RepID=A0A4Y7Q5Q8_9AGAM|nr:PEBP-like protein [Rickenella mellea]
MPLLDPISSVTEALRKSNVIGDVIPDKLTFQPTVLFSIRWGDREVMLGNELDKSDTVQEPTVTLMPMSATEGNATYTLAMLDPDAPSHEDRKYGPFRHWLISKMRPPTPSDVESAAATEEGLLLTQSFKPITTYRPPGPGTGTGSHRYVFLLFREPENGYNLPSNAPEYGDTLEERRKWSPMQFAANHGLVLVGANYFVLASE